MKRIALWTSLPALLIAVTGVVLGSIGNGATSLELTIVATNMAFVVQSPESSGAENPTITVKRGQRVTLVFVNEDPGMEHDLVIEGLGVRTQVTQCGEKTQLTFTAPREPGEYVYLCTFHPRRMRGVFIVE